jgi:hypothetical protein
MFNEFTDELEVGGLFDRSYLADHDCHNIRNKRLEAWSKLLITDDCIHSVDTSQSDDFLFPFKT